MKFIFCKYWKKTLPLWVMLFLSACSSEPYPLGIQRELFTICHEGILSGATQVQHGKSRDLTTDEIEQLCEFRVNSFMKEVSLQAYLDLNQHIYENFKRAYAYKYVLADIYETLSPEDKRTNAKIAMIILGLEEKHAK